MCYLYTPHILHLCLIGLYVVQIAIGYVYLVYLVSWLFYKKLTNKMGVYKNFHLKKEVRIVINIRKQMNQSQEIPTHPPVSATVITQTMCMYK